jgi:uncharacterized phage protein (TIGR01671 family)
MHYFLKAKFGQGTNITLEGKFKDVDRITTKTVDNKDLEVMQFTGLLDKNGKEVWEGDIVDIRNLEPKDPIGRGPENRTFRVQVVWYDFGFSFVRHRDDGTIVSHSSGLEFRSTYYKKNEIEIVGNIWEHPHLINVPSVPSSDSVL